MAGVEQTQVPDLADLEPEPDDLAVVGRQVRAARQHVDQRLPLLGAAVQPIERAERGRRRLAVDQRLLVRVDRAADVLHLALEQLGELDIEVGLLAGVGLDRGVALQRLDQLAPAAALALQVGHAAERAGCAGSMRSACCTEWIAYSRCDK